MGKKKKIVVGITGGLACGKTTAAGMLAGKGAFVIDADKIAHRLLKEDARVKKRIINAFGRHILKDKEIDRVKLRREIFADKRKLERLNRIMHPLIVERIEEEIARHRGGVLVIDAPLLLEAGTTKLVDIVVLVEAGVEERIERAAKRGISESEAKRIIKHQMPFDEKFKLADFVINNKGHIKNAKEGVGKLWKRIQEL